MKTIFKSAALCAFLAGCSGGNPFVDIDGNPTDPTDDGAGISRDGVPPGTDNPSPDGPIFRTEPRDDTGNGFAQSIAYNSTDDTFYVDNLAFDGANVYQRDSDVPTLATYNVYEADAQYPDDVTGEPINQFTHRAIYGVSRRTLPNGQPASQFAIVRTGAYANYGFGGFIYQRNGTVSIPQEGQAIFRGTAAGIRDFEGASGLQYTTADVALAIDFEDFNDGGGVRGDGVRGRMFNRQIFTQDGRNITPIIIDQLNEDNNANLRGLPEARFRVGPGALDGNGDIIGTIDSEFNDIEGNAVEYQSGNYYAILSGDNPDEVVGIVVMEGDYELQDSVTARETSGFIVYRDPAVRP